MSCRTVLTRGQDASTGELFAQVNYASPWTQVEPVLDSSRYFVLRVDGEGGKRAYIGMGFQERGEAFDFQAGPLMRASSVSWLTPGRSRCRRQQSGQTRQHRNRRTSRRSPPHRQRTIP